MCEFNDVRLITSSTKAEEREHFFYHNYLNTTHKWMVSHTHKIIICRRKASGWGSTISKSSWKILIFLLHFNFLSVIFIGVENALVAVIFIIVVTLKKSRYSNWKSYRNLLNFNGNDFFFLFNLKNFSTNKFQFTLRRKRISNENLIIR